MAMTRLWVLCLTKFAFFGFSLLLFGIMTSQSLSDKLITVGFTGAGFDLDLDALGFISHGSSNNCCSTASMKLL